MEQAASPRIKALLRMEDLNDVARERVLFMDCADWYARRFVKAPYQRPKWRPTKVLWEMFQNEAALQQQFMEQLMFGKSSGKVDEQPLEPAVSQKVDDYEKPSHAGHYF